MFDSAKSMAIRQGLNMMLNGRYGKITELVLDSKSRRIDLQIMLNGEATAVDVAVGRYEINASDPERPVIVLTQIIASRQWIQELASYNIEGKLIDIPPKLGGVVKMIL